MKATMMFDFQGIQVPYRHQEALTSLTKEGPVVEGIDPYYVVNLKKFLETGSKRSLENALKSMTKEALLDMVRERAMKVKGWEAPIGVSGTIPWGCVYADHWTGRIVLNETQATLRDIDADGDRGELLYSRDGTLAVLVKYPMTDQPLILQVLSEDPGEVFKNFTKSQLGKLLKANPPKRLDAEKEEEIFLKRHKDVPIGLLTNAWNSADLFFSQNMTWEQRMEYIYNSHRDQATGKTLRAIDIEDFSLKAVRKADKKFAQCRIQTNEYGCGHTLDHKYAWALTSCSSIGEMEDYQIDWFTHEDLDTLMSKLDKLEVSFRQIKDRSLVTKPKYPTFVEEGLIGRLIEFGLLRYTELPHKAQGMPPACIIWLTLPDGTPCALTDVKREDRNEGLTYAFVVGPVFDNSIIFDEAGKTASFELDGEVVDLGNQRKWVHPIEHLQKCFMTFDSTIRPWHQGPLSHYFPKSEEEWFNPLRKEKVAMLQKMLIEWMGKYGDPAPALTDEDGFQVTAIAQAVVTRTVVIDYGKDADEEFMYRVAKVAQKACPFCIVGSKGSDRRVRKYMLANEHGATILDKLGVSSPYRGACQRAQLQRSLKKVTMNVAVVSMATTNGCYITPEGQAKQSTTMAFLPQVFNTEEAYREYLTMNNLTEEQCPAEIRDFWSWTAQAKRCWTIGSKETIPVGKLVCPLGQKFMPRLIEPCQALGKTTKKGGKLIGEIDKVDLIIPHQELLDKDMLHILEGAEQRSLLLEDGTIVDCIFLKYDYYRTGSASENIPPRWRTFAFKGMDALPIMWACQKIGIEVKQEPDLTFAKAIQAAKLEILGEKKLTQQKEVLAQKAKIKLPSKIS